ncbi:unnamed protein product [Owenia fusiformis]|uniref:Uncharacterized protein n=1 Tax=Owenia fusiformis TaxID=6347 RepID=A0A8J1UFU7_OWEFU|nr:unnamed protein product [Owenia fusiformis]
MEEGGCNYDFLQIKDGSSISSPHIGVFCGSDPPINVRSTNNQLYLWFSSDSSNVGEGFEVTYTAAGKMCLYSVEYLKFVRNYLSFMSIWYTPVVYAANEN